MLKSDYWKERAEAAERLLKRETEQHDWDRIFTPEQRETLRRARNPDSAPEKRDAARDALCDLLDLPHYATNKDVLRGYLKDTEARAARARAEVSVGLADFLTLCRMALDSLPPASDTDKE